MEKTRTPLQNFGVDTPNIYTATVSLSRMLNKISLPYNKIFSIHKTTHSYGTMDRHAAFHTLSGTRGKKMAYGLIDNNSRWTTAISA